MSTSDLHTSKYSGKLNTEVVNSTKTSVTTGSYVYSGSRTVLSGQMKYSGGGALTSQTHYAGAPITGMDIAGDARVTGDLILNGVNISETLKSIENRLAILVPNPKKLSRYKALHKAYESYKILEDLCSGEDDEDGSESR